MLDEYATKSRFISCLRPTIELTILSPAFKFTASTASCIRFFLPADPYTFAVRLTSLASVAST